MVVKARDTLVAGAAVFGFRAPGGKNSGASACGQCVQDEVGSEPPSACRGEAGSGEDRAPGRVVCPGHARHMGARGRTWNLGLDPTLSHGLPSRAAYGRLTRAEI